MSEAREARLSVLVAYQTPLPTLREGRLSVMVAIVPEPDATPTHGHRSPLSFGRR